MLPFGSRRPKKTIQGWARCVFVVPPTLPAPSPPQLASCSYPFPDLRRCEGLADAERAALHLLVRASHARVLVCGAKNYDVSKECCDFSRWSAVDPWYVGVSAGDTIWNAAQQDLSEGQDIPWPSPWTGPEEMPLLGSALHHVLRDKTFQLIFVDQQTIHDACSLENDAFFEIMKTHLAADGAIVMLPAAGGSLWRLASARAFVQTLGLTATQHPVRFPAQLRGPLDVWGYPTGQGTYVQACDVLFRAEHKVAAGCTLSACQP